MNRLLADYPKWKSVMSCHVFVDFDGTIVPLDATNELLGRYADAEWLEIEEEWQAGRIGSRECMERQVALLRPLVTEGGSREGGE